MCSRRPPTGGLRSRTAPSRSFHRCTSGCTRSRRSTAHHVIAAEVDEEVVRQRLPPDDLGAPMSAVVPVVPGELGRRRARHAGSGPRQDRQVSASEAPSCGCAAIWTITHGSRARSPVSTALARVRRSSGTASPTVCSWSDKASLVAGRWRSKLLRTSVAGDSVAGSRRPRPRWCPDDEPVFAQVARGQSVVDCGPAGGRLTCAIGSEVLFVRRGGAARS